MPAARSYVASTASTSNATSYTFTNHAIGTASDDRYVAVGIASNSSTAGAPAFGTVTIGGNNATQIKSQVGTTSFVYTICGIYILLVPSGTQATIVVPFTQTMNHCSVSVWALAGISGAAYHTNGTSNESDGTSFVETTLDIPNQGLAVAISVLANNGVAHTASGLTEDADAAIEGVSRYHAMSAQSMSAETARAIRSTGTASTFRSIAAASWAPLLAPPPFRRRTRFFTPRFYRPEKPKLILERPRSLILPSSFKKAA